MRRLALVSGCDANYYQLLREWLSSVRDFAAAHNADICILDAGLSDEQRTELAPHVTTIVAPDWPCTLPAYKIRGRNFLKACVCRPFLPQIFPGYETYFWMDADTWIQDPAGPELFLQGAARGKIALTAQVDRGYPRAARVKWFGRWPWKVRSFYFSNACKAFDFETAKTLLTHHVLQAGAFALRADAPHWARWQELVLEAMQRGKLFTAEQLTLGVLCHLEKYSYEALPAWTHWLCEFLPLWDDDRKLFVEPFLPHVPLSILHLSGIDAMRKDRAVTATFRTLHGSTVQKSYRYFC